ncbi:MAG: hypothetical protein V4556_07120 [Bacteroidota bacterium]
MKLKLIVLLIIIPACKIFAQDEKPLANAFMQSLKTNNYNLLSPYIASAEILNNAFHAGKAEKTKLAKDLTTYNTKIKKNWPEYIANAKQEKVNLSKVEITDVASGIIYKESNMYSLNIFHKVDKRYGMIGLIVFPYKNKFYLLDLPHPTSAFTEKDSARMASEIQLLRDKDDATIKTRIEEKIDTLLDHIKNKYTEAFTANTVYRGEDVLKNWKVSRDSTNGADLQEGKTMMNKLNKILSNCENRTFSSFKLERESEGVWYVYAYQCADNKTIQLAFLKINNVFYLGDIDVEN